MPARDTFTSTVDGAAAHAALFADDYPDDRPDWSDVQGSDWTDRQVRLCAQRQYSADGQRFRVCGLGAHGPDVQHQAHPQVHNVADWQEPF